MPQYWCPVFRGYLWVSTLLTCALFACVLALPIRAKWHRRWPVRFWLLTVALITVLFVPSCALIEYVTLPVRYGPIQSDNIASMRNGKMRELMPQEAANIKTYRVWPIDEQKEALHVFEISQEHLDAWYRRYWFDHGQHDNSSLHLITQSMTIDGESKPFHYPKTGDDELSSLYFGLANYRTYSLPDEDKIRVYQPPSRGDRDRHFRLWYAPIAKRAYLILYVTQ